jgi:two-component sensor histidine kinase
MDNALRTTHTPAMVTDGSSWQRMMHRSERRDVAPKAALALGIAFNELATNVVKYGALSNARGGINPDRVDNRGCTPSRISR